MGKNVFDGLKIALDGNFGENWTREKLKRFIMNNGGDVVDYRDEEMTHLLCTFKAFGGRTFAVKEAIKRIKDGKKPLKVVTFDWFEDCLQERRRKAVTRNYDMFKAYKDNRDRKQKRKAERDARVNADLTNFDKIVADAKANYHLHGYHCYVDPTGFEYNITLLRTNIWENSTQKAIIRLYESDEPPYFYACFSTFFGTDGKEAREVHALPASQFSDAFQSFKKAFEFRARVPWELRFKANGRNEDGTEIAAAYRYKQPETGPLGMDLPPGRDYMYEDDGAEVPDGDIDGEAPDTPEEWYAKSRRKHWEAARRAEAGEDRDDPDAETVYHSAEEGTLPGAMHLEQPQQKKPKRRKKMTDAEREVAREFAMPHPNVDEEDIMSLFAPAPAPAANTGFQAVNGPAAGASAGFQAINGPGAGHNPHNAPAANAGFQPANAPSFGYGSNNPFQPTTAPDQSSSFRPINAHEFVYGNNPAAQGGSDHDANPPNWNRDGRHGYTDSMN